MEEVIPVFGKLYAEKLDKVSKKSSNNITIVSLIVGGVLIAGIAFRQKSEGKGKPQNESDTNEGKISMCSEEEHIPQIAYQETSHKAANLVGKIQSVSSCSKIESDVLTPEENKEDDKNKHQVTTTKEAYI